MSAVAACACLNLAAAATVGLNAQHVSTQESLDALVKIVLPAFAVGVDSVAPTAAALANLDAYVLKVQERCVLCHPSFKLAYYKFSCIID